MSPANAHPVTYWDGRGLFKGDASCQRVSPAVVQGLVGEYLPALEDGEVEIVMIGFQSAMGDVTSVRAKKAGHVILYSVVDEYDSEGEGKTGYKFEPHESSHPLTFGQITDLLWSIEIADYGPIFLKAWEGGCGDDIEDYEQDAYVLSSDFYEGLQGWVDQRFDEWKKQKIQERRRKN